MDRLQRHLRPLGHFWTLGADAYQREPTWFFAVFRRYHPALDKLCYTVGISSLLGRV